MKIIKLQGFEFADKPFQVCYILSTAYENYCCATILNCQSLVKYN